MRVQSAVVTKCGVMAGLLVFLSATAVVAEEWEDLWATSENLPNQGYHLGAIELNSKVFLAGGGTSVGSDIGPATNLVKIYDALSQTWSTGKLSFARESCCPAGASGKVMFAGGMNWDVYPGSYYRSEADIYDIGSGMWTTSSLPPGGAQNLKSTTVGSRGYFLGMFGYGNSSSSTNIHNILCSYDFSSGVWATVTFAPQRAVGSMCSSGTKIYFIGGIGVATNRMDVYDTAGGTWSVAASMPVSSTVPGAAAAGGKIYVAGGNPATNKVCIYDTVSNTWTTAVLSRSRNSIAVAATGTRVLFAGGRDNSTICDEVDVYDTVRKTWSVIRLPEPVYDVSSCGSSRRVVLAGGCTTTTARPYSRNVVVYRRQDYDSVSSIRNFVLEEQTTVGGLMQLNAGSLSLGTNDLTVGSMSGSAPLTIPAGTHLTAGTDNTGTDYAGIVTSGGTFIKTGTGTQTLSSISTPFCMAGEIVVTQGVLVLPAGLSAAGDAVNISAGAELRTAATVNRAVTNNGTLSGPAGGNWLTLAGAVSGSGSYTGNVKFTNRLSPGSSNAAAHVDMASVIFDSANTLTLKIGGPAAGTQYDQLHIGSLAALGGTLQLTFPGGFTPSAGQTFTLISGATSGKFTQILGVPGGWSVSYLAGGVTLAYGSPNSAPAITAGPTAAAAILFSVVASDGNGDPLTYTWNFGDGVTSGPQTVSDISHSYAAPGRYTASVIVSDGTSAVSNTVTVSVSSTTRRTGDVNDDGAVNVDDLNAVITNFGN